MTVLNVITVAAYLSLTGRAAAQQALENSPAMQTILKSVAPTQRYLAAAARHVRRLVDGDTCAATASLSIEDGSFDSTGCYVATAFEGLFLGFMYTETGVRPQNDGRGWDQGITYGVMVSPSTSASSSSPENGLTTGPTTSTSGGITDSPSGCEVSSWKADGICDWGNNNAGCDFDGGDCCECTCVDGEAYSCNESAGFFNCVDPSAPCVNDDDNSIVENECEVPTWKEDGICDWGNNNAGCDFDGGDCCECTCVDSEYYSCGDGYFDCIDPSAPCVNDDDDDSNYVTYASQCTPSWKGDGMCDKSNNDAECDFDGGDCCACTCVDSDYYTCSNWTFDCVDPSAPCVDDDDANYSFSYSGECEVPSWKGDGICDWGNNNDGCDFDGGDCCACTCVGGDSYNCGDEFFNCIDPSAPCVNDIDSSTVSSSPSSISNEMIWVSTYVPPFDGGSLAMARVAYLCRSSIVEVGSHPANADSWSCATLAESSSGTDAIFEEVPASLFSAQCGCNGTESAGTLSSGIPATSIDDDDKNNAGCDYDGGDC